MPTTVHSSGTCVIRKCTLRAFKSDSPRALTSSEGAREKIIVRLVPSTMGRLVRPVDTRQLSERRRCRFARLCMIDSFMGTSGTERSPLSKLQSGSWFYRPLPLSTSLLLLHPTEIKHYMTFDANRYTRMQGRRARQTKF